MDNGDEFFCPKYICRGTFMFNVTLNYLILLMRNSESAWLWQINKQTNKQSFNNKHNQNYKFNEHPLNPATTLHTESEPGTDSQNLEPNKVLSKMLLSGDPLPLFSWSFPFCGSSFKTDIIVVFL